VFIEEYLQDLRRDRFRLRAVVRYVRRVVGHLREDLYADPGAVRSIWSVALGFLAGAFVLAAAMAVAYDRHLAYNFFLHTSLWILPSFVMVTLHIGMMRDSQGYRLSSLNVPMVLTLVRVALLPGIILFVLDGHLGLALAAFLLAGVSDVADGWVARRWNQITRMGTVLDPLVDIVFNFALFAALTVAGMLKPWVFWAAVLRYGILLVGGAYLYLFVGPVRIRPTTFGRMSGVVMFALVAFLAVTHVWGGRISESLAPLTQIALGVLLWLAVAQVVVLGWYNLRVMTGEARARGRVVGDVRWGRG